MNLKKSLPKLHKQVICEMEERMRVRKKGKKTSFLTCAYLFIWLYWVLMATRGIWDPSSPTRDRTWISCTEGWILNHWTTREVSDLYPFRIKSLHGPLNFCGSSFPGFRLLLSYFSPKLENTAVISFLNHRYGICVTQLLKVKCLVAQLCPTSLWPHGL